MNRFALVLAFAACLHPGRELQAQFGSLVKRKIAEKVAVRAGLTQGPGIRESEAIEFDERVLKITDARLDQFVKAVEAEPGAAAAYEKAVAKPASNATPTDPELTTEFGPGTYIAVVITRASGLSQDAYPVMRERVIAFLKNGNGYSFTRSELQSLRAREPVLRKYEKQLMNE